MTDSSNGTEKLADRFRHVAELDTTEQGPPVDQWDPAESGSLDLRIRRSGEWEYEGSPIQRWELVRLFSSILKREGKDYFLVSPVEKLRIEVEDVPFIVHSLRVDGEGKDQVLWFTTNVEQTLPIGPEHPLEIREDAETGEPSPYVRIRRNLYGRIERNAFYHLVGMACEEDRDDGRHLGVYSQGQFYSLGRV